MSQDEFFEKLKECLADALFNPEPNEGVRVKKHYVFGLQGLCDLLGCSIATASRIKQSGVIDAAISQVGNLILYFRRDDGSHERFNLRRVLTHVCRLPIATVAIHEEVVTRPHIRVHIVGADGPGLVIRHQNIVIIAA